MAGQGYTHDQALIPLWINLGATVAAGTGETWGQAIVPATVPTMHLKSANFTNGANLASDTTNYTTVSIQKGASTVMASITNNGSARTADTAEAMTRSATLANRKLAAADTFKIVKAETGTGAAVTAAATVFMWWRVGSEDLLDS